jgi:acyl-CoA thioesterase FadM
VHARVIELRGARFRYEYAIVREDGTLMAEGWTAHACVDARTFKPTRVPDWLADAIASAESASSASPS